MSNREIVSYCIHCLHKVPSLYMSEKRAWNHSFEPEKMDPNFCVCGHPEHMHRSYIEGGAVYR